MRKNVEEQAARLAALGHPVRLTILRHVVKAGSQGAAAGAIQQEVGLPASTMSHHLKRLQSVDVLSQRAAGTFLYYTANYDVLRGLTDFLWEDCCCGGCCG